jgi:hypothetical protein
MPFGTFRVLSKQRAFLLALGKSDPAGVDAPADEVGGPAGDGAREAFQIGLAEFSSIHPHPP